MRVFVWDMVYVYCKSLLALTHNIHVLTCPSRKEKAKSNEDRLSAAQAFEDTKAKLKDDQKRRYG
ncbi:hypothetical protein EON65_03520 [archaeon]|nr:MAG: hypothetical protein EON65_03520 [archaeon]